MQKRAYLLTSLLAVSASLIQADASNTAVGVGALASVGASTGNTGLGYNADSTSDAGNCTAVGANAVANGASSVAVGVNSQSPGSQSVAVGPNALAAGSMSVAVGAGSQVLGDYGIALGAGLSIPGGTIYIGTNELPYERCSIQGINGQTIYNGVPVYISSTGQLGTVLASGTPSSSDCVNLVGLQSARIDQLEATITQLLARIVALEAR